MAGNTEPQNGVDPRPVRPLELPPDASLTSRSLQRRGKGSTSEHLRLLRLFPRLREQMKFINAMNLDGPGRYEYGWRRKLDGVSLREDFKKYLSMRRSMREAEAERDWRSDSSDTSSEAALKFWQYVEDGSLGCEPSASDSGTCPSCPVGDGDDGSDSVGSSEAPG